MKFLKGDKVISTVKKSPVLTVDKIYPGDILRCTRPGDYQYNIHGEKVLTGYLLRAENAKKHKNNRKE